MDPSTPDLEAIRQATAEVMQDTPDWTGDYLTAELLQEYETLPTEEDEFAGATADALASAVQTSAALTYYGHHPAWVPDLSQTGYVGRLYLTNGATNRPNDPCGSMYRRRIWFRHSPRGPQFRNCGAYWSYSFINA